jgi:phage gp29-like protein
MGLIQLAEKIVGRKSPPMGELINYGSSLSKYLGNYIENPDYVLRLTLPGEKLSSQGIQCYRTMQERDVQIAQCLQTRKNAVLGLPWDVIPATEEKKDVEVADFIREVFTDEIENFREDLGELLSGVGPGFAISEIIWAIDRGRVIVQALKGRKQSRFKFNINEKLMYRTDAWGIDYAEVPDQKFLIFRNQPYAENPYGDSVLQKCIWPYWFKKNMFKFWAMFGERFADPILLIKLLHDRELTSEEKATLDEFANNLQKGVSMRVPKGVEATYLEAMRRSDVTYNDFITYCDGQIAKAILGQTLTSGEGERVGSMALGRVHFDTFWGNIEGDIASLEATINNYLIRWLVDFNFAVKTYPQFKIDSSEPEDLKMTADMISTLVRAGVQIPAEWVYQKFSIPAPEKGQEVLQPVGGSPFGMAEDRDRIIRFGTQLPYPPPYPRPIGRSYSWDSGAVIQIRRAFQRQLETVFDELRDGYKALLETNRPLQSLVDEMIVKNFENRLRGPLQNANLEALRIAMTSLAAKFKIPISEDSFRTVAAQYLKEHAYDKGIIEGIGGQLKNLLSKHLDDAYSLDIGYGEIVEKIMGQFDYMAKWKAEQIAYTEIQQAANYAGFRTAEAVGEEMQAWFINSAKPCPVCQDIAMRNPYKPVDAEAIGLPHPNCECQWSFTIVKGKE